MKLRVAQSAELVRTVRVPDLAPSDEEINAGR